MLQAQGAADLHFDVSDVQRGFAGFETVDHATAIEHAIFFVNLHFAESNSGVVVGIIRVVELPEVLQVQLAPVFDVQDGEVAGLPDVGRGAGDEPQGIVVEAGAYVRVAPLVQGLVLVIGAAVGELDGGDVQDTLPGTFRNEL